jgi:hypothetical protein
MILTLVPDSSWRHSYLLCLRAPVNEDTLLRRAKAKPGTYAGELLANLHDAIFRRSLELKRDYTEFYAPEYATFAEYVRKRFLFPPDTVLSVSAQFPHSRQIIHFHPGFCFIEDDYGREFLQRLLEPRRRK